MSGLTIKDLLRERFSSNPEKYYEVETFREKGYERKRCKCGRWFWTLDPDRETCPDSTCQGYEFIGNPPTSRRLSYLDSWRSIEKFFVKNGHTSIQRYPVLCRWFPSLYFTAASIVAFYRQEHGRVSFEMPANPLIIPQRCLRFVDIPNVGVTGRHYTGFVMIGQHSINDGKSGYWKDECVAYDQELLEGPLGIPEEKIVWMEDVWVGPSAFGASLEYYVDGLELGNAVFTEFLGTPERFVRMKQPVIDMGAGLERFVWLSQGTASGYEAVFGDLIGKMKSESGIDYDEELFLDYSKLAGSMDYSEVPDVSSVKASIADRLGLSVDELDSAVRPFEAIYAIADHVGSLSYAIADGGLPSNVGGGYNLRVILRRALAFIDEFEFPFDLVDVSTWYADQMEPMSPELKERLPEIWRILEVEEKRYRSALSRARHRVSTLLRTRSSFRTEELTRLYESEGITPELIKEAARKEGKGVDLPADFYSRTTNRHMRPQEEKEEKTISGIEDLPPTKLGFYEDDKRMNFEAKVLKVLPGGVVVLDQTYFYPRSGGEEPDHGSMDGSRVVDVDKVGNVVLHKVDNPTFRKGDVVHCTIDPERRRQLTIHHTAAHIVNAACREVLGQHIWQAGAYKDVDFARLDVTHYERIRPDQLREIENFSNRVINRAVPIHKEFMRRGEAEARFGFRLYQGGAPPGKVIRVVNIEGVDVEACGGTHLDNTKEAGLLIILKSERIQDGICRLEFAAGEAAFRHLREKRDLLSKASELLRVEENKLPSAVKRFFDEWKQRGKQVERLRSSLSRLLVRQLDGRAERIGETEVIAEIVDDVDSEVISSAAQELSRDDRVVLLVARNRSEGRAFVATSAGSRAVKAGVNAGELAKMISKTLGGGGGGRATVGRGAGSCVKCESALAEAKRRITDSLS